MERERNSKKMKRERMTHSEKQINKKGEKGREKEQMERKRKRDSDIVCCSPTKTPLYLSPRD